jgi:nucleotide-binding universal stress UspA family protein
MNAKSFLIPVDFSPPSMLAVNCGIALARELRATVTLLHVVESPPVADDDKVQRQRRERAERMLSALIAPEDQDDLDVRIVVEFGNIKEEIVEAVRDHHADVIIMGTHGRGLLRRLIIGSVTEGILRDSAIPVLTVSRLTRPLAIKRMLFASDLSECSRSAFHELLGLARELHCEVTIVHVLQKTSMIATPVDVATYISEEDVEKTAARLQALADEASRAGIRAETILREGKPTEVILQAAQDCGADLIVLPVQQKGFIKRAFLGTTAEPVIRDADIPVLCFPLNLSEGLLTASQLDPAMLTSEPQGS